MKEELLSQISEFFAERPRKECDGFSAAGN